MIRENMTDKDVTLENLKREKKELTNELEHYEFRGPSYKIQEIEDKLQEVNDTIKKLYAQNIFITPSQFINQ